MKPLEIEPGKRWGNFTFVSIIDRSYDEKGNLNQLIRVKCECGETSKQQLKSLRYYYKPLQCGNLECFESRKLNYLLEREIDRPETKFVMNYKDAQSNLYLEIAEIEKDLIEGKHSETGFQIKLAALFSKTTTYLNK